MTLRLKLLVLVAAAMIVATVGVTAVAIIRDLGHVQELLSREGAAVAASVATTAEHVMETDGGDRAQLAELATRTLGVGPFESVTIVDALGVVLACAEHEAGQCQGGPAAAFERAQGPVEALGLLVAPAPLRAAAPIISNGRAIGAVRVSFAADEVVRSARHVAENASWVSVFWIAVGLGLATALVGRATRPLTELALAAEKIGTDEPVEVIDGGGGREIDELVHAFHRMSARIRERDEERVRLIADLNRRVEEATRDVLRADRLATLGGIAAGFAHELGNSIHVVRGYTSVALRELPKDHPNRRDLEAIRTESQRAAAMLERFLVFARAREARMERQPVGPILAEVADMLGPAAAVAKVTLETDIPADLPQICVDLELVRQAAMNLCINAIHACEGREHGKVCLRARAAEGGLIIEVDDDGPGVPEALKAKIFEPFFTTKATGTGLGLSIVTHVVSAHRGSVEIDAPAGGGARFRLRLPDGGAS